MSIENERKLLTRAEASSFLAQQGYRVSPATLAKLACSGNGPLMTTFGRSVLYQPAVLLEWAETRSRLRANTSSDGVSLPRRRLADTPETTQIQSATKRGN
jgi:hypothetical protein